MNKFTTSLANNAANLGGFASSGNISPSKWAEELYNGEVSGPWLCCYMIRRFGWPNEGSDPYKQLCSWTLTTPLNGLYLSVTPYLGGGNLHFAVRFNEAIERKLRADPIRDAFHDRYNKAIMAWWKKHGIKLYSWGYGLKDGDTDELVHHFTDDPKDSSMVYGLWKRTSKMKRGGHIPKEVCMVEWWLGELLRKQHPEVKLPKKTKRDKQRRTTRFQIQARAAIKATLRDLLRPTNVRDISFTPFGDIERTDEAAKRYTNQKHADYFHGAGYTPEYYFTKANNKEKRGEE